MLTVPRRIPRLDPGRGSRPLEPGGSGRTEWVLTLALAVALAATLLMILVRAHPSRPVHPTDVEASGAAAPPEWGADDLRAGRSTPEPAAPVRCA